MFCLKELQRFFYSINSLSASEPANELLRVSSCSQFYTDPPTALFSGSLFAGIGGFRAWLVAAD